MGTDIVKSFGTLQAELELARSNLKGLDENIKRIIGRDPNDGPPRIGIKRNANGAPVDEYQNNRGRGFQNRNRWEDESITDKRRPKEAKSVFSRLSGPPRQQKYQPALDTYNPEEYMQEDYYPNDMPRPKVQSRVIRELPSREEVLAAQGDDEKSRGRSRRIFGSLLGTLQKFKQDETRLKSKDDRKAEIERKVEEQATKEREEIKRTRQDLFMNRKKKQAEIRAIEIKMNRMKEYTKWEESMKPLFGFIQLKATPSIYYKPKIMNDAANELLKSSNEKLERLIDKKRQEVFEELEDIEANIMRNYHEEPENQRQSRSKFDNQELNSMDQDIVEKSSVTPCNENTEEIIELDSNSLNETMQLNDEVEIISVKKEKTECNLQPKEESSIIVPEDVKKEEPLSQERTTEESDSHAC